VFKIGFLEYKKYVTIGLVILLVYFAYLIIKPILIPILAGVVLAYIFYPIYRYFNVKLKSKTISAALISAIIILLITIPGFILLNTLSREAYLASTLAKQKIKTGIIAECVNKENTICNMVNSFKEFTSDPEFEFYLKQGLSKVTTTVAEKITNFVFTIPKRLLEVFITFFVMYYLFKDGDHLVSKIKNIFPVGRRDQEMIINQSKNITYGVIYGVILVALIQGGLAAFGFYIFGIPTPLIWGIFTAFASLIPLIGTAFVWLPAALLLMIKGYLGPETIFFWKGIGLIIYSVLIVSSIDNILKPRIIAGKTKVHPIVILIGVIGGIALMGFIGALIGPLLLSILINIVETYKDEIKS